MRRVYLRHQRGGRAEIRTEENQVVFEGTLSECYGWLNDAGYAQIRFNER